MKKNSYKKVILTSLLAFLVSLIIFIVAIFCWFKFFAVASDNPSNAFNDNNENQTKTTLSVPRKTNFLLTGVDQTDLLTDVILVGCFDSKTGDVTLISVPRDTYVEASEELRAEMKADNIYLPSQLKINAIHSYAGKEKGIYYLEKYLEETMGIEIDYYAEVDTKAFRDIVDAVGGIDMQVRDKGYHYYDPTQNLTIEVPGGMQHLDGEMAEGVVRFRHDYVQGDIGRIDVQHEFMTAFFEQVLDKSVLAENGLSILKTCISYTNTNFKISELPRYIPYLSTLNADNFVAITAPGRPKTIGGASYYLIDDEELSKIVNQVFYGNGLPKLDKNLEGLSIEILNGSDVPMLATEKQEELNAIGYNVNSVGDFKEEVKPQNTVIYAKEGVDTSALDVFFTSATHEVSEEKTVNHDIVIVLGTMEQ